MRKGRIGVGRGVIAYMLMVVLVLSLWPYTEIRTRAEESGNEGTETNTIELIAGTPYELDIIYYVYAMKEDTYDDGTTHMNPHYEPADTPEGIKVTYTPSVNITAEEAMAVIYDSSNYSYSNDFQYDVRLKNAKINGVSVKEGDKDTGRLTVTLPGEQYSAEHASIYQNKNADTPYEITELKPSYNEEDFTYSFNQDICYNSYENSLYGFSTVTYSLNGTLIPMVVRESDTLINGPSWSVKDGIKGYFIPETPVLLDYNAAGSVAENVRPSYLNVNIPQKRGFGINKDSFCYGLYSCEIPVTHSYTVSDKTCKGVLKIPVPEGYSGKSGIISTKDQFIKDEGSGNIISLAEYTAHATEESTDEWAYIPVELEYRSRDDADGKQYYLAMDEYYITFSRIADDTDVVEIPIYQQTGAADGTIAMGRDPALRDTGKLTSISLKNNKMLRFIKPYSDIQYCTTIEDETEIFDVKASNGFDKAIRYSYYMYVSDYFDKSYTVDKSYDATIKIPVPAGVDPNSATLTSVKRYSDFEAPYLTNVKGNVNSDGTVSFPITFYTSDNTYGYGYEISMHIMVEFKKPHTHTVSDDWSSDENSHWKECTVCKEVVGGSTAHVWNGGEITTKATSEKEGVKTYTCTVCGATKTEKIEKQTDTGTTGGDTAGKDSSGGASSGTGDTGKTTVAAGTETKDESGATFTVKDTSADTTNDTVEVEYKAADTTEKTVTIPTTVTVNGVEATVTSIADNAFEGNKTVTTVTIPSTVEDIGNNAFKGCTKLTTVSIPASVEEIGSSAFENCTSLKKVTLPKSVEEVGKNAFAGCSSLTTVTIKSTTITKIDQGAFKNCKKLTKITITKNVTTIGKEAFSGDKKLKTITITSTKLKSVGKNAFKNVPKSTTIKVPKKQKKAYTKLLKKAGFKGKIK